MKDYKSIFDAIEKSLFQYSTLSHDELRAYLDPFKGFENKQFEDDYYFRQLIQIVFYSGFKAETVTNRIEIINRYFPDYEIVSQYSSQNISAMLADVLMIRNKRKIESCVFNAGVFKEIVQAFGSFQAYIDSFQPTISFENLMLLKEELEYKFSGLGRITVYHFLTEIGLPVLKPDVVICRIFKRLGLIESEHQLLKTVIQGRKFAEATGHPIRYIDVVFVVYGQLANSTFGIERGICLQRNPQCQICQAQPYCEYYEDSQKS